MHFTINNEKFQLQTTRLTVQVVRSIIILMPEIIVFLASLAVVIKGSDWLGRASVNWAKQFGLPNFIVGATFVAAATSLPELVIAFVAGPISHEPKLALGAVLGSPLINIGIILALALYFTKQRPSLGYFSRAINIFIVLSALLLVISLNSSFGNPISLLLLALGVLFVLLEFVIGKKSQTIFENLEHRFEMIVGFFSFTREREILFEFIFGGLFLVLGGSFLVSSALAIASTYHINELFLGSTLIAFGTSLPELLTTINSLVNKREDLAIGVLVGASVMDLSLGVGLATLSGQTSLSLPINLLFFLPLVAIGVLVAISFWKKIPLPLISLLLVSSVVLFLLLFSFYQLT